MIPMDWIFGLIGGLIIGSAAVIFLAVNGRVMGASGILGGLLDGSGRSNRQERLFFIGGLIGAPALYGLIAAPPQTQLTENIALIVIAGLLVGIGTRIANGCTSGHGVCGISRLSLRGIVATVFYLLAGGIAMILFRHVWEIV